MIDASKGFRKDGPKNRLGEQDIHRVVDIFTKQADVPRYTRLVPLDEIADPKNDFNLNLPRYIDSTEPEDRQDIDGHLRGGIPERDLDALGAYWKVLPSVRGVLFESAGRPGYARLKSPLAAVKPAILGHAEFAAFQQKAAKGCVATLGGGLLVVWRNGEAGRATGDFQRAADRARADSLRCALGPSVLALVPRCRRAAQRALPGSGPHDNLALGPALRSRTTGAAAPSSQANQ